MSDLNAYWFLHRANSQLENANAELNRPSDDIVTFSVCHRSKGIIADFFRSFLLLHGVQNKNTENLESLRCACATIDLRFSDLELRLMDCHPTKTDDDHNYCLDINRVKSCIQIADDVKNLVDESFRKKEKNPSR